MRYHFIPTGMAIINITYKSNCWHDMEKLEPPMQNGTAALENHLLVLQRVTQRPSNSTPRYIPKRNKNIYPHKNLYMNVIGNNPKSENLNTYQLMNG